MKKGFKKKTETEIQQVKQFCTFWLFGRHFGVDILSVKEISTEVSLTPVYHAPPEVKGYVNIRGQIYLVIDLALLLGHKSEENSDERRQIVLFKNSVGETFGVLVDKVGDVVEVSESIMEEYQKWSDSDSSLSAKLSNITEGVCRLEGNLLVILNPETFLPQIKTLVQ